MKLLLTGHCNTVFMVPLVKALRAKDDSIKVYSLGLNRHQQAPTAEDRQWFVDNYAPISSHAVGAISKGQALWNYLRQMGWAGIGPYLWNWKGLKQAISAHAQVQQQAQQYQPIVADKDVVMVHYLTPANLKIIDHLPPHTKLVLCFWGSDLLLASDTTVWPRLHQALRMADAIVVQHEGMRFLCCVKYGWELKDKIRFAMFPPDGALFKGIRNTDKALAKQQFGAEWNIPKDKIWLSCGYRPIPMVQQVEIIEVLGQLSAFWKEKIVLILTMNYSNEQTDYIQRIFETVEKAGIQQVVIDRYLEVSELIQLRKATDVFIHLPLTDAMSLTLLEHLHAGNFVVTGRSLPFTLLRKHQVEYEEVDQWPELLVAVKKGLEQGHFANQGNMEKIEQLLEQHLSVQNWVDLIEEFKIS